MLGRMWSLSVVALVALMVAAGCGNDDGAQPGAGAETTVTSPDTTTPVPAAAVRIVEPADGAIVTSPVTVRMEATGFVIEPAGEVREGAGHFHVMVNAGCVTPGEIIPSDENHLHYGQGQAEAELTLPPGRHTLCLQVGDGAHAALDLTDTITIEVGG